MKRRALIGGACASVATSLLPACGTSIPRPPQRVGYLSGNRATSRPHTAFVERLHEVRAIDDADIVYGGTSGDFDELRSLTAKLVAVPVDVIVAAGGRAQKAAAATDRDIPIVLVAGPEPVREGLVRSNARPDANITGVARDYRADALKMVQLLTDAVPRTRHIAFIYRSDNTGEQSASAARDYGREHGIEIAAFGVADLADIDAAVAEIGRRGFDGIITTSVLSATLGDVGRIPAFAIAHGLPQIFGDVQLMNAGGLMYFGPNYDAMQRRAAEYVDKILRGARPQDLPIELIARSDFGINFETATRMHLAIPEIVLAQATRAYP